MRATYWSVTAFNEEIEILEKRIEVPDYIKEIVGGVEKCPKSEKLHFQGMLVCNHQVRLSKIKKWLPTAHLEPARNKDDLRKYALKAETAVGEKSTWTNDWEGLHGFSCRLMTYVFDEIEARPAIEEDGCWYRAADRMSVPDWECMFNSARSRLLKEHPKEMYRFMNAPYKRLWCETALVWFDHLWAHRLSLEDSSASGGCGSPTN